MKKEDVFAARLQDILDGEAEAVILLLEPDPERPFVLYTVPKPKKGYRVALY